MKQRLLILDEAAVRRHFEMRALSAGEAAQPLRMMVPVSMRPTRAGS